MEEYCPRLTPPEFGKVWAQKDAFVRGSPKAELTMKQELPVPIWVLGVISLLKGNILPQRSSHEVLNADTDLFEKPRPLLHWYIEFSDSRSCFFPANQELASVKNSSFQPSSPYHEGSTEVTGQPVTGRGPPSV